MSEPLFELKLNLAIKDIEGIQALISNLSRDETLAKVLRAVSVRLTRQTYILYICIALKENVYIVVEGLQGEITFILWLPKTVSKHRFEVQ